MSANHYNTTKNPFKPAYYIIDPKLDTRSLVDYLNNSLADGTRFHLDTPLNLLHAKITNVSRKHLLGMLTSCYEVDDFREPADDGYSDFDFDQQSYRRGTIGAQQQQSNLPGAEKPQMAYLINSDLVRHLENASKRGNFVDIDDPTAKTKPSFSSSSSHKKSHSRCAIFNLADNYLSSLYVFVKALYLLSAVCQLVFLNRLIGNNFYVLGLTLIQTFFKEIEWPHLDVFPVRKLIYVSIYLLNFFFFNFIVLFFKANDIVRDLY